MFFYSTNNSRQHTAPCRFDLALQQNEICDIFVDDYTELSETDGIIVDKTDNAIKEYQSYTDLTFSKDKIITWIDWHPSLKGTYVHMLCNIRVYSCKLWFGNCLIRSPVQSPDLDALTGSCIIVTVSVLMLFGPVEAISFDKYSNH